MTIIICNIHGKQSEVKNIQRNSQSEILFYVVCEECKKELEALKFIRKLRKWDGEI